MTVAVSGRRTVARLVAYDRIVFENFQRGAERRGWSWATINRETGHRTVKDTLAHVLNVYEAWLVAVAQGEWAVFEDVRRRPANIGRWADLRAYRDRVWTGVDRLVHGLTDAGLRRRVKAPWMPGRYTLEDAFYQVSFEQAHHLGEVIAVHYQLDLQPPSMTWIENRPAGGR